MPRGQGGCRRHEEPETPPDAQKGASNFVCPAAPRASQPEFRASRLLLRPVRAEQSHWRKPGSGWGREQSPPEPCQPGYESHCGSLAQPAGPVTQTQLDAGQGWMATRRWELPPTSVPPLSTPTGESPVLGLAASSTVPVPLQLQIYYLETDDWQISLLRRQGTTKPG